MKYHNQKTQIDNIVFDSKAEASYYLILKSQLRAGEIKKLRLQVPFELQPKYINNLGEKIRSIKYIADFVFEKNNQTYVVDVKGKETAEFKIKWKILGYKYPELILQKVTL